ncbi:MAG TPA: FAD-dependent oxidoreductase [Candidatus Avacidaminococcus intestinavium]|uniref:FAD-dependent oxidoreductase n=1 Tax=Candidatus Avacidaminococcus intestinavium TaxID=2840684 RepID=A0A9D1SL87_9FIRM|nr:FAD-dependent oxidoreductase [Candidatus Avacidaminococcus intestinavium]
MEKVVIVGGVAAGMKAAARLRRLNAEVEIIVLERGSEVSYGACGFPYYIGGDVATYASFTGGVQGERNVSFFDRVKGIKVLVNHEVLAVNRNEHTVTYLKKETGETKVMPYDKLVLATGATPTRLPIAGNDLLGIYNFWFPQDVHAVKKAIVENNVTDVVIVGAGLIGMELAEAFHKQALKVSIVEMQDRILPQLLDKELADLLLKPLSKAGINVYLNERTVAFEGQGKVTGVRTDARLIPAQLVIVAVGVKPNIELAAEAGLTIGPSGCIAVNKFLQTSDADIFAGGDCAENTNLVSGKKVFAPMGSTANKHGRVIADNLAGDNVEFPGILGSGLCQVLDWQAGSTGLNEISAAQAGMKVVSVVVPGFDRLGYMPGANRLILKLFAEAETGLVVGAQAVGTGGVDKRIDTIAALLTSKAHLKDLSNLDVGYAPPFNGPIDNIATAANVLRNKLDGRLKGINPKDFQKMKMDPAYTLVDVRMPEEFANNRIAGCAKIINIPLHRLRKEATALLPDKAAQLICSCQADVRGYEAEVILRNLGYTKVQSLEGGMLAWPYETEGHKTQ